MNVAPNEYAHIIDLNTLITRLIVGPQFYTLLQNEKVALEPDSMICLEPLQYCVIRNPVVLDESGNAVLDSHGQVKLRRGHEDYRFQRTPFPLYPGEELQDSIRTLRMMYSNEALRLRARMKFTKKDGTVVKAGDEWLFEGPGPYFPRVEVEILEKISATEITQDNALCLKARQDCTDRNGIARVYGEKWLVTTPGLYLPSVYEEVVEVRIARKLSEKIALHMRAIEAHTDKFGNTRRLGEEWLITRTEADSHICSVSEVIVSEVQITILNSHQYCVILNPVDDSGVPQWCKKLLVRGEKSFFLKPGEELLDDVHSSYILQSDEGLILRAEEQYTDEVGTEFAPDGDAEMEPPTRRRKVIRSPGDQWMIRGPLEYVPPIEVEVVAHRKLIPLDANEGIYVRNVRTGEVRAVIGQAYMLDQDEELWEKKLPTDVVELLQQARDASNLAPSIAQESLDMKHVITYQVPHNAATQLYDYKSKVARVEFGPTLVMLGPNEKFTKLSLSGGCPKKANQIQSLCLYLGPTFWDDSFTVETADHARLTMHLLYKCCFALPKDCDQTEAAKLFVVSDFVGDACKAICSLVRSAMNTVNFADFHKNSTTLIRTAVFGVDENGQFRKELVFPQNNLHITSVDIQSAEPVDQNTRDSMLRYEADRLEQEARARLEKQKIEGEVASEEARRALLETRMQLAVLESTGQAKAEAQSRAEGVRIECEERIKQARLRAEALAIETEAEVDRLKRMREVELKYTADKDAQTLKTKAEEAQVEIDRFTAMVTAIGADTIRTIATASADQNLRMLSALGLQSTLITDGNTPINLLTTAHGLIGQLLPQSENRPCKSSRSPYEPGVRFQTDVTADDDHIASASISHM